MQAGFGWLRAGAAAGSARQVYSLDFAKRLDYDGLTSTLSWELGYTLAF